MANTLIQTVTQEPKNTIPKRVFIQYDNGVSDEPVQQIVNYEDLTTEEKATFDAYKALCESKMV